MPSLSRALKVCFAGLLAVAVAASAAVAHTEREAFFPDGSGQVPAYRAAPADPYLVVCKEDSRSRIREIDDRALRTLNLKLAAKCRYEHIQDAVNAVDRPGTTIYILPGVYEEDPNRDRPACADEIGDEDVDRGATVLSYEQQLSCPHAQNLIAVMGDINPQDGERACDGPVCDLQIEGTGASSDDVLITGGFREDGEWMKLNGIRGDRADGLYLKNFTIELFEFNAVYVLETDGFVIDDVVTRYNDEYGILAFAVDHGLIKDCEGYGNGDAAVYPGSASDVNSGDEDYTQRERWAVEITGCKAHHNAAGYSGTAGNSVNVHDNDFYANATGIVTDSIFPDHPGLPQDHAWFHNNRIFSNNENYFENVRSGLCDLPPAERGYKPPPDQPEWTGTVCPLPPVPVGSGIVIAGGNWNLIEDNQVWDNWRTGFMLISVPAAIRDEFDPSKQFDTSHFNRFTGNRMGLDPNGDDDLNGVDFWWDDNGEGNCWQGNEGTLSHNAILGLPDCDSGGSLGVPFNPAKQGPIAPCATYDRSDPFFRDPPLCDFFRTPEEP